MTATATTGALSYEVAHLFGVLMLVLSFALLARQRLAALIVLYAVQAGVLAATAAWQGAVQAVPGLYVVAAATLVAKAVGFPLALRRLESVGDRHGAVDPGWGLVPTLALGLALVGLATLVVPPMAGPPPGLTHEDLALALSVVLLGLLMMVTRQTAPAQAIGFLSMENGLGLAVLGVSAAPMLMAASLAALALPAAVMVAAWVRPTRAPDGVEAERP